jgi:hypothetical protein
MHNGMAGESYPKNHEETCSGMRIIRRQSADLQEPDNCDLEWKPLAGKRMESRS